MNILVHLDQEIGILLYCLLLNQHIAIRLFSLL